MWQKDISVRGTFIVSVDESRWALDRHDRSQGHRESSHHAEIISVVYILALILSFDDIRRERFPMQSAFSPSTSDTRYVITYSPPRAWNSCRSLPETTDVFSDPWKRAPMSAIVIAVTLRRPTGCLVAWATPCRHATLVNWRKWRYSIALEDVARPMPPRYDCRSPIVWNPYAPRTTAKSNYSARGPTAPRLPVSSAVPLFANIPEECTRIPGGKKKNTFRIFRHTFIKRRPICIFGTTRCLLRSPCPINKV